MKDVSFIESPFSMDLSDGHLKGQNLLETSRTIGDLQFFFENESKRASLPQDLMVYEVQALLPVKESTEGGLFFGRTCLYPGLVSNEYFMTKGHFHQQADRAEFYWGIKGDGYLILMNRKRETWAERMYPGSLHYIPAHTAHRTANTGNENLIFGACWPSDAGHDYDEILKNGFSARLKEVNGLPRLVV